MKEIVYKCEVCKKPVNGDGMGVEYINSPDYIGFSVLRDMEKGFFHYCGMEHLIKDLSRQVESWKKSELPAP